MASESKEKEKEKKGKGGIVVKGIHDVAVRFSKCCNPVPGDEIVGFVTEQIVLIFLISQLMKEQGLLKLSGSRQRIKMRSTVQRLIYMQAIE